jgi:hypothetical protein
MFYSTCRAIDSFKQRRVGKNLNVNKIIYAAAGGIAAAAIAIFFLLGPGIKLPGSGEQRPQFTVMTPEISLKNVTAARIEGTDDAARMSVVFAVKNPNPTTLVLETIHYDVSVDNVRVAVGDWGGSGEGFVTGSDQLTVIVSGTTVSLKDTDATVFKRTTQNAQMWDEMVSGDAKFSVTGTYSYRLTAANLETTAQEHEFSVTFP